MPEVGEIAGGGWSRTSGNVRCDCVLAIMGVIRACMQGHSRLEKQVEPRVLEPLLALGGGLQDVSEGVDEAGRRGEESHLMTRLIRRDGEGDEIWARSHCHPHRPRVTVIRTGRGPSVWRRAAAMPHLMMNR